MKRLAGAITLALAFGGSAPLLAQDGAQRIDTPSGPAILSRDDIHSVLTIGGQRFVFDGMPYAAFGTRLGDVVLLSVSSGGSMCPAEFVWLDTRPGLVRLSDRFGTCSDLAEVTWDAESLIVTMPSMRPGEGQVAFHWDGKSAAVREQAVASAPSGVGVDAPARVWIGRHPAEFLAAPEQTARLTALLGPNALQEAQRIISVATFFTEEAGWITASGCQPHQCDVTQGAVALHPDGRVGIALWQQGEVARVWGTFDGMPPPAIARVLQRQ